MPSIDFHTGADDPLLYACQWLDKACGAGLRVQVQAQSAQLDLLDKALWTFSPQAFVAHARLRRDAAPSNGLAPTPIWLVDEGVPWPMEPAAPDLLLRLDPVEPLEDGRFDRVVEIFGADERSRVAGRQRWRAYLARGWTLRHHDARGPQVDPHGRDVDPPGEAPKGAVSP